MKRKTIQLLTVGAMWVALCDDGTIWVMAGDGKWTEKEGPPQPSSVDPDWARKNAELLAKAKK